MSAASRRIHLIGVCGTAMATVAALLKARGHDVRGSDQNMYPPMSDFLAREGIRTFSGYDAAHVAGDVDLVVVASPAQIDDAVAAVRRGAFDFVLRPFYVDDISITVACACARRQRGYDNVLAHVPKNADLLR